MTYSLNQGLSWCDCAGRAVFLDLPRDRYFRLASRDEDAFRQWAARSRNIESASLDRLVAQGVIVPGEEGPPSVPVCARPMTRDLGADGDGRARGWDVVRATLAQKRAEWAVRHQPLAEIVRQSVALPVRDGDPSGDPLATARMVASAFATASLLVRKTDQCLPRALAGRVLCARAGLASTLVFGVRLEPFAAHCWVQWDEYVLIGDFEEARMFTPILMVP
jgi:hypothetical protein